MILSLININIFILYYLNYIWQHQFNEQYIFAFKDVKKSFSEQMQLLIQNALSGDNHKNQFCKKIIVIKIIA